METIEILHEVCQQCSGRQSLEGTENPDGHEVAELMCDHVTRLEGQVEVSDIGMVARSSYEEVAGGRIPAKVPDYG